MAKILVVEDETDICAMVCDILRSEQHTVESANDGLSALHLVRTSAYDLILLDIQLPGMNGLDLCKEIRSQGVASGVLMLTGQNTVTEIEGGLDAGADDYLTKPFNARELIARVRALLRRSRAPLSQNELRAGNVEIDLISHKVRRNGEEVHLPPKQYALLEFLMRHKGQVFSADTLVTRVWPADNETSSEIIRNYINHLRKTLDVNGETSIIRTLPKVGYLIQDPDK